MVSRDKGRYGEMNITTWKRLCQKENIHVVEYVVGLMENIRHIEKH